MSHSYRDLAVWQKAIRMVSEIYQHTAKFPREELYGLAAQLRSAAVSVPSNIAEGQGRLSKREFKQFLAIARGSLLEVETQLFISKDLGYLTQVQLDAVLEKTEELLRMLNGLMSSIS